MNNHRPQLHSQATKQVKYNDIQMPTNMAAKPLPKKESIRPTPAMQKQNNNAPQYDLNQKLRQLPIDLKFKELLGPDMSEYKRMQKRKEKERKTIEKLKQMGKIQIVKTEKKPEKIQAEDIKHTDDGKLIIGGSIVQFQQATSLKINKAIKQQQKIEEVADKQKKLREAINEKSKYFFDKNLAGQTSSMNKRQKQKIMSFNFIEKGSLAINAELRLKNEIKTEDQQPKLEGEEGVKQEEDMNMNVMGSLTGFKRHSVKMRHHDPIPNIEWWDAALFPQHQSNYIPIEGEHQFKQPATAHTQEQIENSIFLLNQLKYNDHHLVLERITNLIEHPKPFAISELVQNREKATLPSYLTKKERKKRLRKIRQDAQKDKQDKVRLGLLKPSPPRIRLSNLMQIMCTEAVNDPSKAEQEVRKQIQARYDKHLQQNESRQLTKEQRGDKLKMKWQKDASQEIRVAVFRIENLTDPQQKFKVNMNAQQTCLQGVCLVANPIAQEALGHPIPSIVVAEGGPKGIKFYKKLLLNRIKWNSDGKPGCYLVWEGIAKQHAFNKWRSLEIKSEAEGKRILAEKGVDQFWDLAMNLSL